jgi:hypothetical protein
MNESGASKINAPGTKGRRLRRLVACVAALGMGMTLYSETAEARGLGWGGGLAIGAGALLLGAILSGAGRRRAHAAPHSRAVHQVRVRHNEKVTHKQVKAKRPVEDSATSTRRDAAPSVEPLDAPVAPVATPRPIVPVATAPQPVAPLAPAGNPPPAAVPPLAGGPAPATAAGAAAPPSATVGGNVIKTSTGAAAAGGDGPGAAGLH